MLDLLSPTMIAEGLYSVSKESRYFDLLSMVMVIKGMQKHWMEKCQVTNLSVMIVMESGYQRHLSL